MNAEFNLKNVTSFFILLIVFISCAQPSNSDGIKDITADELIELQYKGTKVIDVRSQQEVALGKIPRAEHVMLSANFVKKLEDYSKSDPIIVYCKSGGRSAKAAELLKNAGYQNIYNYSGSFNDWVEQGKKIE